MSVPTASRSSLRDNLAHRYREYSLIARDPVLLIGLLVAGYLYPRLRLLSHY